jgi:hypothetical protein
MRPPPWNTYTPDLHTRFVDLELAQELRVSVQTTNGRLFNAVIHTDTGIAILLIALAALVVAALGLWSVLALVRALRRQ